MKLLGTIRNGHVRLDQPSDLPDGTRTVSLVEDEFEDMAEFDNLDELEHPHPMAPYDPVKEAALIRARMAAVAAGGKTTPLAEAMDRIRRQLQTMPAKD